MHISNDYLQQWPTECSPLLYLDYFWEVVLLNMCCSGKKIKSIQNDSKDHIFLHTTENPGKIRLPCWKVIWSVTSLSINSYILFLHTHVDQYITSWIDSGLDGTFLSLLESFFMSSRRIITILKAECISLVFEISCNSLEKSWYFTRLSMVSRQVGRGSTSGFPRHCTT